MSIMNDFQIENGVLKKYIGSDADVTIPDSVTCIGKQAFKSSSIASIIIPGSVVSIEEAAFFDCRNLKSVVIQNGVKKIGEYAFYSCKNLVWVEIPDSIESIDTAAFCSLHMPTTFILSQKSTRLLERWNLTDPFGSEYDYQIFLTVKEEKETRSVFLISSYSNDNETRFFSKNSDADMADYDKFVLQDKRYKTEGKIYAAFARLSYQYKLSEEVKTFYIEFLEKNLKKAVTIACEQDNVLWLQVMLNNQIINAANVKKISSIIEGATENIANLFKSASLDKVGAKTKKSTDNVAAKHPIEVFCKENFNEKEINAVIKKSVPFANRLENVMYKDGSGSASDFVVKCAIAPYIAQMDKRPKHIGGYKKDIIDTKFEPLADKVAEALETNSFLNMLEKIAEDADYNAPQCFIPFCRFGTPEHIKTAMTKTREWTDWDTFGASGRSAIIVVRGALMLSDHPAAVQLAEKGEYFWKYTGIRGFTVQEYRDEKSLPDIGFDADGVKRYGVDGKTYEVRIGSTLTLELTLDGKAVKSIPKKTPEGEVAAIDFVAIKKEFSDFVKKRMEYIKSIYITGETIAPDAWLRTYGSKMMLLPFTERVIWQNGKSVFFEVTDGKIRDVNGDDFMPTEPVRIAHVINMTKSEIEHWQSRILELRKPLLIEQVWEPVAKIEKGTDICGRYEGAVLTKQERNEFKKILKEKAITVKSEDQGYNPYTFSYGSNSNTMIIGGNMKLDYVVDEATGNTILGKMSKEKLTRKTNTILFELDRLCIRHRIISDDAETITDSILESFTLAQIAEFIDFAVENNSTNCTALLLDYRNKTYGEDDPFSMFVL